MKNVSRNKFLLCFRPVVDMDFVLESKAVVDHPKKKALTYNSLENKEDEKASMTKSSLSGNSCSRNSESLIIVQPAKRTLSQVIKAVVFETILAKRVRHRKLSVSINSQRCLASIDDHKSVKNQVSFDSEIHQEIKSNIPVLSTSSSLGSNSSCSSSTSEPKNLTKSLSDKKNNTHNKQQETTVKPKKEDKCGSNFNTGIYLLLMSLTLTVLWGKVCAIVFTSIWFYFVPTRHAGSDVCKPEYVTKLAKAEPRDYKKRVIMEGLLERKPHNRGALNL